MFARIGGPHRAARPEGALWPGNSWSLERFPLLEGRVCGERDITSEGRKKEWVVVKEGRDLRQEQMERLRPKRGEMSCPA